MEYDDILINYLGEFGLFQRLIYFTICLIAIPGAFNTLGSVFLVGVPEHWCNTPGLDRFNLSQDERLNLTIPTEEIDGEMVYSSCQMYNRDYTNWSLSDVEHALNNPLNGTVAVRDCDNGWIYDKSLYESTAVTEFDMVCSQKWMQATSASVYMAGMMVGVIVFGAVSDLIGRQLSMCIAILLMVTINISIIFVNSTVAFMTLRFFLSMASIAMFTSGFVMSIELVGPSWRVHVGTIIEYYWAVGYMILAGIAYAIRDWRKLQMAISIPSAALLIFFFIIPESPRWLYITNRHKRGDKLVRKIAKWNKVELPEKLEIVFREGKRAFIWDVLRRPRMCLRTINVFFNWFVNSFVYYGLSLNSSNLGGDPYLNFLISGAVEIPAYIFVQIVPSLIGRRLPLVGTLLLGGVSLLLTLAVPADQNTIAIVLAMIGKFGISASFALIYIFTAELYPTPVRNICVGVGSFGARIGGIVAPYVALLSDYGKSYPLIIFGSFSVAAGLLSLLFPETKGRHLPETLEDGENFGKKGYDKMKREEMAKKAESDEKPSSANEKESNGISQSANDDLQPNGVYNSKSEKPASNGIYNVAFDANETNTRL